MTAGLEEIDDIEALLDPAVEVPPDVEPQLADYLPRGYLSPSQVTGFLNCAHSWYLQYIERKPRKSSARMFQGTFVHTGVEAVLRERLLTGTLPSVDHATDAFSDTFEENKGLIQDWEGAEQGSVKDVGVACTKAYYEEAALDATPLAIEKTATAIITSADGKTRVPVLGRIDSIQVQSHTEQEYQDIRSKVVGGLDLHQVLKPLRIHDLKIVTDKWNANDLANDLQFATYAGVEHIPDVQVDMVVKGRAKVPRPRYEKLTAVITPRQILHVQEIIERVGWQIAGSLSTGKFTMAAPDAWCCSEKWCSVWQHCRGKA